MMIELSKLHPNPFRNFRVDPLDEENIAKLAESISEHDFWGGPTCRRMKDGSYQIAAGHHRIEAAIRAGIKTADIHVGNYSDEQMIRVYAVENATQRGNTSTALGGSVASAVRFVAKDLLVHGTFSQFWEKGGGRPTDPANLGEPIITKFLHDVPEINKSSVALALGQIKSCGEYAAILADVETEIEEEAKEIPLPEEQQEERKERVKKAKKKAGEREITFDRNGVAPHFKNPNHMRVFQQEVEKPGIREKLAVSQQAALAEAIVKQLADEGRELSGASIRDTITAMVIKVRSQEKEMSKKEKEELLRNDMIARAKHFQAEFSRSCRGMTNAGIQLSSLRKDWPKDLPFPTTGEFREAVRQTKIVVDQISKEL